MPRILGRLCFGYQPGITPLVAKPATTPECEPHEPSPTGYVESSEWAEEMLKAHVQRACRGCGLYLIWVPKGFPDAAH